MKPDTQRCNCAENNISKTGYRALFLFFKLLEAARTRDEILELFSNDPLLKNDKSKDTVTITVNTLKNAGCIISRPNQRTKNKYVLKSHPFNLQFSVNNIYALQSLRESLITFEDLDLLIYLNNFYFKIAKLAPDVDTKNLLIYKHPLALINFDILNELIIYSKLKKQISICYDSPQNKKENLDFVPEYLTFENDKLYVWGYCKKYNNFAFLRVDKIKRVNCVQIFSNTCETVYKKPEAIVTYKLKGYSALMYTENNNETIMKADTDKGYCLTIKSRVVNKFNFFQKILSYGTDCVIVSPESIRQELLVHLNSIKTGYKNNEK